MAVGVTDVEDDTTLVSLTNTSTKPASFIYNRGLLRRIAVSHDVARSKGIDNLLHRDGRVANVNHHRSFTSFAGLNRHSQRFPAVVADGPLMKPNLDPDADVARIADALRRAVGISELQVLQFPRIVQDSMLRQRNKRQHPRTRLFVNQFFEAEKVDRPG